MNTLGSVSWGSSPVITVTFGYERQRVGAAMQYRTQVTVSPVSGASSFGYPIYCGLYINGVGRTTVTLKNASPSRWTSAITWTSDWYTVADKTSGTTPVSFNLYSGSGSTRNSTYSYAMTVDPAASTLTASSGTLGQTQTLTLTRYSSTFKDTVAWTCGTASGNIAELTQDTSFSFTPSFDLASQAPSSAAVEIRFTVTTYQADGTTLVATSSTTIAAAIPESVKPSCTFAVSDATGYYSSYGAYVQGRSKLRLTVTPTLAYGSEIAAYQITADGKTYTAADVTTDTIAGSGTLTLTAKVTDRRGRSSDTATMTIDVLPCVAPQLTAFTAQRCNAAGTLDEEGVYIKVTFSASISPLNNKNTAAYKVRYRKSGTTEWTEVTLKNYAGQYTVADGSAVFAAAAADAWDVQMSAADAFTETAQTRNVGIAFALVNYNASGQGIAFGRISQLAEEMEIDMPVRLYDNLTLSTPLSLASGGTGASDASSARTALTVPMMPKLLWSGSWTSGSLTVAGISDYSFCICITSSGAIGGVPFVMYLSGSSYRCYGATTNGSSSVALGRFGNQSGNTLTLSGSNISSFTAIYGLVRKADIQGA